MENTNKNALIEKGAKKILDGDPKTFYISNNEDILYLLNCGMGSVIYYLRGCIGCCGKQIYLTEKEFPVRIFFHNKRDKEWAVVTDTEGNYLMSSEDPAFNCNIIALVYPNKNRTYGNHPEAKIPEDVPVSFRSCYDLRLDIKMATVTRNEQLSKLWFGESKLFEHQSIGNEQEKSEEDNVMTNTEREMESHEARYDFAPSFRESRRW